MKTSDIVISSITENEKIIFETQFLTRSGFGIDMWKEYKAIFTDIGLWFREKRPAVLLVIGKIIDEFISYESILSYTDTKFMRRTGLVLKFTNGKKSGKLYFDANTEKVKTILLSYIQHGTI